MTSKREHRSLTIARTAAWSSIAVSIAVLVGWTFEIETLKRILPSFVSMKVNTAIAFFLTGAALLLSIDSRSPWFRRVARVLIAIVAAIGIATLAEYLLDVDFGIDQAILADTNGSDAPFLGRMAWATAVSFVLMSAALATLDRISGRVMFAQWLALIVFVNGYVALLAYAYDFESLYRVVMYTSMALHTALLTALLGVGILAARPSAGFMRAVLSDGASGIMFRRIVPVALVLPIVVNGVQLYVGGGRQTGFGQAVSALCNAAVFIGLGWWTARSLREVEFARNVAQARLETGQERLGMALQSASGGAWDWDLKANVAWWSPEMYAMWGVNPGTEMGLENSLAQIVEQDRERVQRAVELAIAEHRMYECEFRVRREEGEAWMISRGKVVFDAAGQPERLVGITLDITSKRSTEHQLRLLNEALERSNAELRRFAHIAAHDLQTPMRSIASFADLLLSRHAESLDVQARQWLTRISLSVHRLQALVSALLRYASIEAATDEFVPVAMNEIFAHTNVLLGEVIKKKTAKVTADPLPIVIGDSAQLGELLKNLVGNAIEHASATRVHVHVSAQADGERWRFTVRDNGSGIDAKYHARIFDMFERLHGDDAHAGTGVGLAICRKIVERHGGSIWVESEPGRGSAFHFTLRDAGAAFQQRSRLARQKS